MYLQTLVILLSIGSTVCDFLPVQESCQYWNYLNVFGNEGKKQLHCILDQDYQAGLVYTDWKMVAKGKCPIYNRYARQITSILCNENIGMCPNTSFPSYHGVTYSGCYGAILKQTNVIRSTIKETIHEPPAVSDHGGSLVGPVAIATLLASTNCMFIIFCVWHFICRSKIKLCKDQCGVPRSNVDKNPDSTELQPEYADIEEELYLMVDVRAGENVPNHLPNSDKDMEEKERIYVESTASENLLVDKTNEKT